MSTVFKEMCELYCVKKIRTSPLYAQSDGMVERFNRGILAESSERTIERLGRTRSEVSTGVPICGP